MVQIPSDSRIVSVPDRVQLSEEMLLAAIGDKYTPAQVRAAVELLESRDGVFPSENLKIPPNLVNAVHRERLLAAALKGVSELGYPKVSIQELTKRAGISRRVFYLHYGNVGDCFVEAFEAATARLRDRIQAAASEGESWRDQLRLGLKELLRFVVDEPDPAGALIVEARASCPAVLLRDGLFEEFASCIHSLLTEALDEPPPPIAAIGIVGGIETLLYTRLRNDEIEDLESVLPSLMYFAVLPYAGPEAAREELAGG